MSDALTLSKLQRYCLGQKADNPLMIGACPAMLNDPAGEYVRLADVKNLYNAVLKEAGASLQYYLENGNCDEIAGDTQDLLPRIANLIEDN